MQSIFTNPIIPKSHKTICDLIRYRIFQWFIEEQIDSIEDICHGLEVYEFLPMPGEIVNFPQVALPPFDEDDEEELEDIDFENSGDFIINNENSITFSCGGDWQEPKTFSVKIQNGKPTAYDITDGYIDKEQYPQNFKIICKLFNLNFEDYNFESTDPNDLLNLYIDMIKNKDFKLEEQKDLKTEDCINSIIKYFQTETEQFTNPKNWKRTSKSGSGVYTRIFLNKITKDSVRITSTNTDIIEIIRLPF